MAKIIKADGTEIAVTPKNGKDFKLDELQPIVGGYIEIVYLPGRFMVVNEEGKLMGLPINGKASFIAGETIVGDVLVCDRKEIK